jgi:zinc transport system ATP-binding protein
MTALATLENVHVDLGGLPILRGVSAGLRSGQITALIGLNGSGKTTLLRAILGEIPYGGRIRFLKPTPPVIGYVPQRLVIDARMPLTVSDLFALALQRWPVFLSVRPATAHKTLELLARVFRDPEPMLRKPVEKISGGELQRVLLALALEPRPELLLLDEPAQGIDFQDQERFYDLIASLNRELGVTVVLVSHDLTVVTRHAHHVLCLRDGRIRCEGAPGEVLQGDTFADTFGEKAAYAHHHHAH